jgi:hypothetical protein
VKVTGLPKTLICDDGPLWWTWPGSSVEHDAVVFPVQRMPLGASRRKQIEAFLEGRVPEAVLAANAFNYSLVFADIF